MSGRPSAARRRTQGGRAPLVDRLRDSAAILHSNGNRVVAEQLYEAIELLDTVRDQRNALALLVHLEDDSRLHVPFSGLGYAEETLDLEIERDLPRGQLVLRVTRRA